MLSSEPHSLSNEAIESEIAILSAQIDTAEHRLLALVRELDSRQRHRDHGLPSMTGWLTWRVGLGPVAAREKVRGRDRDRGATTDRHGVCQGRSELLESARDDPHRDTGE